MKKITIALLVLTLAAMSVVNCFAADVSTAITDLDLIYFDDFSDATKYDYSASDNYIAEIDGQSLYMMTAAGGMQAYMLPGAPELSGLTKATFVYSFTYDMYENMKEIGILFGLTDEMNGFFLGITPDHSNGIKSYYAPIEDSAYKKDGAQARRYGYFYSEPVFDDATKRIKEFDEKAMYTVVIEFEVGTEPVHTIYVNGEPTNWHMAEPGGNTEYSISADTDVTLNGPIGFGLKGSGILLDGIAVYGTTGLDHRELVAKVASEGAAGEAPATEAPTTEAPVTEAPVTEAPVTEAPATEAPATEAPATEAPATDAPATEAPATDAPTTDAPAEGGCGGVIGIGAIVAILGAAVVLKKRD